MEFQKVAKLGQLTVEILVHSIKALLQLLVGFGAYRVVGWVMVDVGEEDGLRKGRLNVLARATIAVAACANLREEETACQQRCKRGRRRGTYFVVERAVDTVLLCAEDVCLQQVSYSIL